MTDNTNMIDEVVLQEETTNVEEPPVEELQYDDEKKDNNETPEVNTTQEETKESNVISETLKQHATMSVNPRREYVPPKDKKHEPESLGVLSQTLKSLEKITENDYFINAAETLPEEYAAAFRKGTDNIPNSDVFTDAIKYAIEEDKADFVQEVTDEDKVIKPKVPKWGAKPGDNLTGIKAIAMMQYTLKQGSLLTFPCWSSGVWLTLRAPTQFELADYYDLVSNELISLGRQTNGAVFNNTQVHLNKHLIDLAERLLYSSNIKESTTEPTNLRNVLLIDDLETIAWAIGVIMYPNGYPFEEACVNNVEKCNYVIKQTLNLSKLFWVNRKRLTKYQIEYMTDEKVKRSMDDIRKYRSEAEWLNGSAVEFDGFKIHLKVPTIQEHIDAGYGWMEDIRTSLRDIVTNPEDSRMDQLIFERAGLTILRGYAHYVKSIVFDNGGVVDKKEDINNLIDTLCVVPEAMDKLSEGINKFIAESTITMCAINKFVCPECGKPVKEDDTHPHLIPMSALKLFFNLRDQKLQSE